MRAAYGRDWRKHMTETAERSEATKDERSDTDLSGPSRNKGRLLLIIGVAVVVVAALVVGALMYFGRDTTNSKSDAKNAATALTAGLQAQTKGDLAGATTQFNKVLSYDKNNKYALYDLALIDSAQSNYGLAETKYRRVLAIDSTYEPALFNLAILVQAKGDNAGATALYGKAVKATPNDASAHLNLGLLLRTTGHKAAGDAQVKTAIKLNPKLVDPARQTTKVTPTPKKSPNG
jgi:tetratricopeptide (TPR) repeat protein